MAEISSYEKQAAVLFPIGLVIEGSGGIKVAGTEMQLDASHCGVVEVTFVDKDKKFVQARSVVLLPPCALTIPVTQTGELVLVRVLRPGARTFHWEFPQERAFPDKDPNEEAIRCAREEVGLISEDPVVLPLGINPWSRLDRLTEETRCRVVIGSYDLSERKDKAEMTEGNVRMFSVDEAVGLVASGEMTCCANIAALLWFDRNRGQFGLNP